MKRNRDNGKRARVKEKAMRVHKKLRKRVRLRTAGLSNWISKLSQTILRLYTLLRNRFIRLDILKNCVQRLLSSTLKSPKCAKYKKFETYIIFDKFLWKIQDDITNLKKKKMMQKEEEKQQATIIFDLWKRVLDVQVWRLCSISWNSSGIAHWIPNNRKKSGEEVREKVVEDI